MARRHVLLLMATIAAASGACPALADPSIANDRLEPGIYPAAPVPQDFSVPSEPGHLPVDIDWSLGLKGTFVQGSEGDSFVSSLVPGVSIRHDGRAADIVVDGSAEIIRPWGEDDDAIDLTDLDLGISVVAPIDSHTEIDASASINLDQEWRSAPELDPVIIVPPEVATATLGLGVTRKLGPIDLTVRGDARRVAYGPTTRLDTGVTDNSDENLWDLDASLRAGFQVTPIFEVFGEASVGRDYFDRPSGSGLVQDANTSALRGGVSGQWNGVLTASASAGVGYRNFDDEALGDVTSQLHDASLVFNPNATVSLAARLATTIDPVGADESGSAVVNHVATADLSYVVNSRLRLRAAVDWGFSDYIDSVETEERSGAGLGADYRLNAHTALSADYDYHYRNNSVSGEADAHMVSLGVTVRR